MLMMNLVRSPATSVAELSKHHWEIELRYSEARQFLLDNGW